MDGNKVKATLRENSFKFKKGLGQNFICDEKLLDEIVTLSGVEKGDTVVEIGCGAGTLTRALAKRAKRVIAFEVDKSLTPVLEKTLAGVDNAEVVFKDFLKLDTAEFERELESFKVVANLPYYITTPLIMKLIEEAKKCASLSVMVQKEVAERLTARENTPEYGAITAILALVGESKIILNVSKEKFTPSPKVDSAVVRLDIERGRLGRVDEQIYKKVVHAAFLSRRKTLENNLVNSFSLTREKAKQIISDCGVKENARGETLSPEQFVLLANRITDYK